MNINEVPVLTVDEAAEYLRIPKSSLYKLAQEGKVPCQKVGRHWRFSRNAIDLWLANSENPSQNHTDIKKHQES